MAGRASTRIARRLGGPADRRRRHQRVAVALVVLFAIAGALLLVSDGDGDGDGDDPISRACQRSNTEIATAQRALLEDNTAPGAAEGFLADAFVDLTRDRSAAIRAVDPRPSPEVVAVLDEFDAVVDAIEADPSIGLGGADPFTDVDARWVDLGLDECAIGGGTVQDE